MRVQDMGSDSCTHTGDGVDDRHTHRVLSWGRLIT